MGIINALSKEYRLNRLSSYKSDLCNDDSAVHRYNRHIDSIISDYQSFIRTGNSAVADKLDDFKEPSQSNDGNLNRARNYIQYEINKIERED